ncbi:hypothetical protein KSP40_PGU011625 [Platanthera guangdongensis]|uniref:Uncharacterized protein n=1 Tax=Platanthera guangdongensis TaxID=2320717 RepID=A0ABR2MS23_9ASPA
MSPLNLPSCPHLSQNPSSPAAPESLGVPSRLRSISSLDLLYVEALDIFETGGTLGVSKDSLDSLPKLKTASENIVDCFRETMTTLLLARAEKLDQKLRITVTVQEESVTTTFLGSCKDFHQGSLTMNSIRQGPQDGRSLPDIRRVLGSAQTRGCPAQPLIVDEGQKQATRSLLATEPDPSRCPTLPAPVLGIGVGLSKKSRALRRSASSPPSCQASECGHRPENYGQNALHVAPLGEHEHL